MHNKEFYQNHSLLIRLDIIFAKTEYSVSIDATQPEINNQKIIALNHARHPLIDKNVVVPIDIRLGEDAKIMIISARS